MLQVERFRYRVVLEAAEKKGTIRYMLSVFLLLLLPRLPLISFNNGLNFELQCTSDRERIKTHSPFKQQQHPFLFQSSENFELAQIADVRFLVLAKLDLGHDGWSVQLQHQKLRRTVGIRGPSRCLIGGIIFTNVPETYERNRK